MPQVAGTLDGIVENNNCPRLKMGQNIFDALLLRNPPAVVTANHIPHYNFVPFTQNGGLIWTNAGIRRTEQI